MFNVTKEQMQETAESNVEANDSVALVTFLLSRFQSERYLSASMCVRELTSEKEHVQTRDIFFVTDQSWN